MIHLKPALGKFLLFVFLIVVFGTVLRFESGSGMPPNVPKAHSAAIASLPFFPSSSELFSPVQVQILRVVDGDTLDILENGTEEKLRLLGINTPEIVDPRKPVQCFGKEASALAKNLLPEGTEVSLVRDKKADVQDKYGRQLGYIFLPDGTNFNQLMIESGFAHEYTYMDQSYFFQKDFKNSEKSAQDMKIGLWEACF